MPAKWYYAFLSLAILPLLSISVRPDCDQAVGSSGCFDKTDVLLYRDIHVLTLFTPDEADAQNGAEILKYTSVHHLLHPSLFFLSEVRIISP